MVKRKGAEDPESLANDPAPVKPRSRSIKKPRIVLQEEEGESDDEAEAKEDEEEEEKEKPKSRAKAKAKPKPSSSNEGPSVQKNAEGDKYIDLGKKRRATVRSFKGSTFIDIREFFGDEGDLKPGKKGITLNPEQWEVLKNAAPLLDDLLKKEATK